MLTRRRWVEQLKIQPMDSPATGIAIPHAYQVGGHLGLCGIAI